MTTARPRGIALIINNAFFAYHPQHGQLSARHGSEVDVSRVKTLFAALDFSVRTEHDLSKQQLLKELDDVACQDHSAYDCFVLWLMSYGRSGEVFCSDGNTISIDMLHDIFSNCDTLRGKPKLFFIQACRGKGEDELRVAYDTAISSLDQANRSYESTKVDPDELSVAYDTAISSLDQANRSYESTKVDPVIQLSIPSDADFLYAFCPVDEYVSYRNHEKGSHYVRCFVEAFREHVAHDHILDILTIVNNKVTKIDTERPSSKNRNRIKICKRMPEVRHTLRKTVRF